MKIGRKLSLALLGVGIFVLLIVTSTSLWQLRQIKTDLDHQQQQQSSELTRINEALMAEANAKMLTALAQNYADTIESKFEAIAVQVGTVRSSLESAYAHGGADASRFADDMVYLQPGVKMETVRDEFHSIKSVRDTIDSVMKADPAVAMYYVSESGMLLAERYVDYYEGDQIDRRTRPWYLGAAETGDTFWTPIYVDALSGNMTITCSAPVYDKDGRLMGVIASDILLDPLIERILTSDTEMFQYIFLTDENGEPFVGSIPGQQLADFVGEDKYERVLQAMLDQEKGAGIFEEDEVMTGFSLIPATGWRIGIVLDYGQITAPKQQLVQTITDSNTAFQTYLSDKILFSVLLSIAVALLVILLVLFVASRISRSITRPVEILTRGVEQISSGNLEQSIELHSGDEIEILAAAFNKMTKDLKEYIENLATVTAERERIATELDLATKIQSGMLPSIFPALPDREDIDLYAAMIPAKEVGGDFYDFFLIDDDHLGLVIADVSGKGIGAALFMVIAKTLLKNAAQQGLSPKEVLAAVNHQLAQNNDENMFVTVFIGILNIATGQLAYASAGHNPPYIIKADGTIWRVPVEPALMLAVYDDIVYGEQELQLEMGWRLVLYTDGVTEAMNQSGALYGDDRFEAALRLAAAGSAHDTLNHIYESVRAFEAGAEATDDLTMLVIQRTGIVSGD